MKFSTRQASFFVLATAIGCSASKAITSPVCTDYLAPAVAVYVKDSLTNGNAAAGASLVVREGSFKDSVAVASEPPELNNMVITAAAERGGTYNVTVDKPGYVAWTQSNVRVTRNECHVNTVTLTALLQKSP
jgi:hypothetical protein